MSQPVICEYFIQNDEFDINPKSNPYPNIFMLTKKYNSISDVRLKDVIDAFPVAIDDPDHSYVLRFESLLQLSSSKKISVWLDVNPS